MAKQNRLNGAIGALEQGKPAFTTFTAAEISAAQAINAAPYDAVVFEMEHNPYDITALRNCMQYMLNRQQILAQGTLGAAGGAYGAHSAERQRDEPMDGEAGARYRRLRHRLAACQHG